MKTEFEFPLALLCDAELKALREIVYAAKGLSLGVDWNHGTHAKIYRPKLIAALKEYESLGDPK